MLHAFTLVPDVAAIEAALVASWIWYRAGLRQTRRIFRLEVLEAADLNRVVAVINRRAVLNKRAALASAFSAACFAVRFGATLLVDLGARGQESRPFH